MTAHEKKASRTAIFLLIARTALALAIAAGSPNATIAQSVQESSEKGSNEFVVKKDERFQNYHYAFTFALPLRSIGLYAPRGNFFSVELRPADEQAFFVYHTSFRIRREAGLAALVERVYGPCPLPAIPPGETFRIATSCPGKVGLNTLERHIVIERRRELLHLLVVTARVEQAALARQIVDSVEINRGFCFEDRICPYR